MKILRSVSEVREELAGYRNKTVGLVPTMGYFHDGHLSLMRQARAECDVVVVSLFVNPTQFGVGEDYDKYPRDEKRDAELAGEVGVDYIFAPPVEEMYSEGFGTFVEPSQELSNKMCGVSRPGHFRGVATVVTKLLNIVQPDKAYFGQKDAQQLVIIKSIVRDLNIPVEIVGMPIVRERDGLAMSSRNTYLSKQERKQALALYETLCLGKKLIAQGSRDASALKKQLVANLSRKPGVEIDYLEIVRAEDLKPVERLGGKILLAGAIRVGDTRLIDNMILEV
ncbi:MAG: pantoate--beta-alanine ligase [Thermoanaerobacteraceae bacterium]|nr:pantoate--beta-alanine ligase [Thermoanaerobacteraceae bacterium]